MGSLCVADTVVLFKTSFFMTFWAHSLVYPNNVVP